MGKWFQSAWITVVVKWFFGTVGAIAGASLWIWWVRTRSLSPPFDGPLAQIHEAAAICVPITFGMLLVTTGWLLGYALAFGCMNFTHKAFAVKRGRSRLRSHDQPPVFTESDTIMTDPKTTPTTPTDSAVAELINKARAAAPATASPTGKSRAEALQEAMEQNENDQHERVAAINFLDTEEATRHQQYLTARQTFLDEMDALAADHDKLVAELHRLKQGLTPRGAPASKPAADNPSLIDRLKGAGASGSDDPSSKDPKDSKKPGFGQRFVMGLTK